VEVAPVLDRRYRDTRVGDGFSPGLLLFVVPGTEGDMVNTAASHVHPRPRPRGAKVYDRSDLVLIGPETQTSTVLADVFEAHDVSKEPCRRVRIDHIEQHAVEGVYSEFGGNVRMNRRSGRRFACGGPGHDFEDQPVWILAAQ
ncbi:uncharacterized protein METZ01_LOCUS28945, partial [marine metagenome]